VSTGRRAADVIEPYQPTANVAALAKPSLKHALALRRRSRSSRAALRRQRGTSIDDIVVLTGWKPHSARAILSVAAIRKKQLPLVSQRNADGVRRYHLATRRSVRAVPAGAGTCWCSPVSSAESLRPSTPTSTM